MTDRSCQHEHHAHTPAVLLAAALPLGLVLCVTCGVHVCADELAAALEVVRALPALRLLFLARRLSP